MFRTDQTVTKVNQKGFDAVLSRGALTSVLMRVVARKTYEDEWYAWNTSTRWSAVSFSLAGQGQLRNRLFDVSLMKKNWTTLEGKRLFHCRPELPCHHCMPSYFSFPLPLVQKLPCANELSSCAINFQGSGTNDCYSLVFKLAIKATLLQRLTLQMGSRTWHRQFLSLRFSKTALMKGLVSWIFRGVTKFYNKYVC